VTRRVELHIDELVLHGFPPGERGAIVESLTQRLAEVVDTAAAAGRAPREFQAARPSEVGAAAARAVASEIAAQRGRR